MVWLTPEELAARIGVSVWTVRDLGRLGVIPSYLVGARRRYVLEEVVEALHRAPIPPTTIPARAPPALPAAKPSGTVITPATWSDKRRR